MPGAVQQAIKRNHDMNVVQIEEVMFFSVVWLYWWVEGNEEPLSFDGVPSISNIALPSIIPFVELKGVAV